jgi:hypothetical protein
MNIPVKELKKFSKLSSHIVASGITPSSKCIKFGGGTIIKNAHHSFVMYDCEASNENILVDENDLWALVNGTASDFINITSKGGKVILSDGKYKMPLPVVPLNNYNELPIPEGERLNMSHEFLSSLGRSAGACGPSVTPANLYMYVHIGDGAICSGNGFMGVCFPVEEDYKMVIEAKIAAIVSKNSFTQMAESKGHYFFYADNYVMGFSKQEIGWFNMKKALNGGDTRTFTIGATDVLSFNSLAMSLSKDFGIITMSTGKIEMDDTVKEKSLSIPADAITVPEPFSYNAENMNKVVSALDVEELDFYHTDKAYFIKSTETKATAIIAKIHKP